MKSSYRVRFANTKTAPCESPNSPSGPKWDIESSSTGARYQRSRFGCKACKARRVKCDETFPACLRCQRQKLVCLSTQRPVQWQEEIPWMLPNTKRISLAPGPANTNTLLLPYWLKVCSQMMCLDPSNNPLSFPLLAQLSVCSSLVHAVQSVSAGHKHFFSPNNLEYVLQERGRAMKMLGKELHNTQTPPISSIFTVFLLGISATWADNKPVNYGKEHFAAAKSLLRSLLNDKKTRQDPLAKYLVGWYLYWDMSCSFIADPDPVPLSLDEDSDILEVLLEAGESYFHPMIGFNAELYYLIAFVGRYCRRALAGEDRDFSLENYLEDRLFSWAPIDEDMALFKLGIAYRNHGLILLAKICPAKDRTDGWLSEGSLDTVDNLEGSLIQAYVRESLQALLEMPTQQGYFNFQSIPLLTVGAELSEGDVEGDVDLRDEVVRRFKALYSCNHIIVNLWAIDILEEIWALRDAGVETSWVALLLQKGWRLTFA
ncbi:fungal-specific transcription factor domain-containing protein [Penicillium robsamsonii]|uniref:fungal-specific transcription factor domain-containing protein n=1 Tax=Penicillium robsamsonii TaxID=1792511 RepID=UPI0025466856|nr:fungal-specific transcription factor domain-containing protein [Penicillium robsamsonii]KAJ5817025.1 fungal-specific transcription factor domain-containing protein [Penicillium robsamsonii]